MPLPVSMIAYRPASSVVGQQVPYVLIQREFTPFALPDSIEMGLVTAYAFARKLTKAAAAASPADALDRHNEARRRVAEVLNSDEAFYLEPKAECPYSEIDTERTRLIDAIIAAVDGGA